MLKNKNILSMKLQLLASDDNNDDETLEDKILKMQEKLLEYDKIIEENEKLKTQNEKLFNKNQEYFLKITGNVSQETNDEENEYMEYVGKEFYETLSNKEKKQLKIILEGEDE